MDNLKQFNAMGPDDNWRTQSFRQSVVAKIEEAIHHSGMKVSRNSSEMENHVFMKAKSREEYMNMVAKLILHVREMSQPKPNPGAGGMVNQGPQGPNQQVQSQPGQNPQGNQSGLAPDPINALQNLASQGSRNPMMNMGPQVMGPNAGMMTQMSQQGPMVSQPQPQTATNLLQTLNQRPQLNMQMQNKMGGQMMVPNQGQMGGSMMGMGNPMGGQMQGQMGPNMQGQMMGNMAMGNNMQGQMGGVSGMGNQMPCNQVVGGMGNQMPNNAMQGQMVGNMQGNQMVNMNMLHMGRAVNVPNKEVLGGVVGGVYRGPSHNQFLRQSPSPSAPSPSMPGPSPVSMGVMGGGGPLQSPMSAMGCGAVGSPSPSAPIGSHHHQGQRTVTMNIASPSSSLNTPGGAGSSPGGEEAAYREKVRQLAKYIEPLRRMINRMVSEGENVEKLTKMKNLLDILSNPNKRMPLETLIKCEVVLEKLDFKRSEGLGLGLQVPSGKEQIFNPLLEVVNNCLQSPIANHTLKRTFGSVLDSLNGPELKNLPAPIKQPKIEEPQKEIPEVLQGEIARLDSRFKVSLDSMQLPGDEGSISLFAQLDSDKLPCVPPLQVTVPRDYPKVGPSARLKPKGIHKNTDQDSFLSKLQKAMDARCKRLPKSCSVGQLLDAWEMSVRQACAPNNNTSYNPVPALGL